MAIHWKPESACKAFPPESFLRNQVNPVAVARFICKLRRPLRLVPTTIGGLANGWGNVMVPETVDPFAIPACVLVV